MSKFAELPDGTRLEFPDDTQDAVIDSVVRQHLGASAKQPSGIDVLKSRMESERQASRDITGGFLREAGAIGSTILAPVDYLAEKLTGGKGVDIPVLGRFGNINRGQEIEGALKESGVDPKSFAYGGSRAVTGIAGTAGIGGGAANLLTKFAPKAVQAAPALVDAIRAGGFSGNASMKTNALGGAITGALASTALNPDLTSAGVGGAVGAAAPGVAKVIGQTASKVANALDDKMRAKDVLTQALGGKVDDVMPSLQQAAPDVSVGQALADRKNPVLQALQERADQRLATVGQAEQRAVNQDLARQAALREVAGGAPTETAARETEQELVSALGKATEPNKQRILANADTTTDELLGLQDVATSAREGATSDVQRVRDFVAAGERADTRAQSFFPVEGMPRISGRYSYFDTLAKRADEVADAYAQGSLDKGQLARVAEQELAAMQEAGLKPLTADNIIGKIRANLRNEEFAGLSDMRRAMGMVEKELRYWSDSSGVIGATALDAIRKNVINSVSTKLAQGNPTTQQKLASALTEKLRPLLIKSMEDAGGKGYGKYLADYSQARQVINQQRLGAEAQRMYQDAPEDFIRLVEGNSPKKVEEIFGPGSYSITKEMSAEAMDKLGKVSKELRRDVEMQAQAQRGRAALEELLEANLPSFRLPMWFNWKATVGNKALAMLEDRIGKKTMDILANSLQNTKSAQELLSAIPPADRMRTVSILKDPKTWGDLPMSQRNVMQTTLMNAFSKRGVEDDNRR